MILKPNMVISGKKNANRAQPPTGGEATVRVLKRYVPAAVPALAFLSAVNRRMRPRTFELENQIQQSALGSDLSYGRALQDASLKAWAGQNGNLYGRSEGLLQARQTQ